MVINQAVVIKDFKNCHYRVRSKTKSGVLRILIYAARKNTANVIFERIFHQLTTKFSVDGLQNRFLA